MTLASAGRAPFHAAYRPPASQRGLRVQQPLGLAMFLPRVGTALMPQTRHRSPSPLGAHSPLCGHFSPGGSVSVEHGLSDRRTRLASPTARGTWPRPRVCHPVRKRLGPQGTVRDGRGPARPEAPGAATPRDQVPARGRPGQGSAGVDGTHVPRGACHPSRRPPRTPPTAQCLFHRAKPNICQ